MDERQSRGIYHVRESQRTLAEDDDLRELREAAEEETTMHDIFRPGAPRISSVSSFRRLRPLETCLAALARL